MKKLLSLLSVLTISGTAVPTTIAAIPYKKQENNEINYQQISNKSISPQLENNNNNSWLEIGYSLLKMAYQKIKEIRYYLLKQTKNIENYLKNLIFSNYSKNLSYEKPYSYNLTFKDDNFIRLHPV